MSIPKEGARRVGKWKVVFLSPDVCLVQVGQALIPTPFPCVATIDKDIKYAKKVNFTGEKAMTYKSKLKSCQGDAAGNKKGIKSGTKGAKCWPSTHASKVNVQGSPVIRHLDTFQMNNGNTCGKLYCYGDMSPYPLELAQANTGTMSDAPPLELPKPTVRGAGRVGGAAALADLVLQGMTRDSSHDLKAMTAILNGKKEIVDHNLLWGRRKGVNPLSASHWKATGWPSESKYGMFISPEERIPLANDILSAKAGRPLDIRSMTQEEVAAVIQADAEKTANQDTTKEKTETQVRVSGNGDGPEDPCEELNEKIKERRDELAKRRGDMLDDIHDLYNKAYEEGNPLYVDGEKIGSWKGHEKQYKQKRRNLQRLLDEARAKGCTVETEDAGKWSSNSPPDRPRQK